MILNFFPTGGGSGKDISEAVVTLGASLEYTGAVQTQQVASVVLGSTTLTEGTDYVVLGNTGTNAGSYQLTVLGFGDYSGYVTAAWSISKKSITKPTISGTSFTYNGSAQGPTITGFDGTWMSKTGDSATNAGNYMLTIGLLDPTNTEWSDHTTAAITQTWTISKATPTVTAPTANTLTYDGTAHALITAGSTTGGELQYSLDGSNYSTSIPTGTGAGGYTVYYRVVGGTNYNDVTAPTLSVSIAKAQGTISISPSSLSVSGTAGATGTATITKTGDGTVSASSSATGVATVSVSGNTVTVTSVDDGTATITVTMADGDNYLGATCTLAVNVIITHIYGVSWDKTSSSALTRTDDAALFTDPVPALYPSYISDNSSSPFDNRLPWSGMVRERVDGNEMVKIPKFWYKWTNESNSLKLQISNAAVTGFHVSPAHADRGDGKGERDYVYIGRYHCDSNYKSTSGATPIAAISRATARTGCKNLGTGFSQLDYAMWWTVRMLYLVEFAHWDSQEKIGYGGGNDSAAQSSGASNVMGYHTGTLQGNRTSFGVGVQYRYIEDPWGNVADWCDGIVISGGKPYVTNVIANYGDSTANHTQVSSIALSNGSGSTAKYFITGWNVPAVSGLEWALFPSSLQKNNSGYIEDSTYVNYSCVSVGGSFKHNHDYGMFYLNTYQSTSTVAGTGARLQYLP